MKAMMPWDTNLENSVLGALIQFPEVYTKVRDYITDDNVFYQKKAKLLWRKLKVMLKKNELVDLTTVTASLNDEEISNGVTNIYVVDCTMAACISSSTEIYTKKLYEKYLMRRVVEETTKIQTNAMSNGDEAYDFIINASSLGLKNESNIIPTKIINAETVVYDIVYKPVNTELLKDAKNKNAQIIYGYEMLLGQASRSFEIWL